MNEITVARISEPEQDIIVHAGDDYVALAVYFCRAGAWKETWPPDEVAFLGVEAVESLIDSLGEALQRISASKQVTQAA